MISERHPTQVYKRQLRPAERRYYRAPNCNVVMVLRLSGDVKPDHFQVAIRKIQMRHRLLRIQTILDDKNDGWFVSKDFQDLEFENIERQSDDHWMRISLEKRQIQFDLKRQSPVRFILLYSDVVSDLIIVCHHMLCDGLSLAYLARDILTYMGEPERPLEILPDPDPVCRDNISSRFSSAFFATRYVKKINKIWAKERVLFDDEDYNNIFEAFWKNHTFRLLVLELTKEQSFRLFEYCRREAFTVNSFLLASLLAAQYKVQGDSRYYFRKTGSAINIRGFLLRPPGETMGLYVTGVPLNFIYSPRKPLREIAKQLHNQLQRQIKPEKVIPKVLAHDQIDPTLLDAAAFKRFGGLVLPEQNRYDKLSAFSRRKDCLLTYNDKRLREGKRGVVITNLGNLAFLEHPGKPKLEKVYFFPGATEYFEKGVGAVTANGKLTLVIGYIEEIIDTKTLILFKDKLRDTIDDEIQWCN